MPSINPAIGFAIFAEARRWVGTPYAHQGRLRGSRVDCIGLIIGTGKALGLLQMTPEDERRFDGYGRQPNPASMGRHLARHLVRLPMAEPEPGMIGWFEWRPGLPMHTGVIGRHDGRLTLIHAWENVGRCVEHGFGADWPGRVNSWWSFPGALAEGQGLGAEQADRGRLRGD